MLQVKFYCITYNYCYLSGSIKASVMTLVKILGIFYTTIFSKNSVQIKI